MPEITTGTVPEEAVAAAAKVAPDRHLGFPGGWEPMPAEAVRRMLEAAAPAILAAGHPDELASQLAAALAGLEEHILRRAEELAEPLISQVWADAAERVRLAEQDNQRMQDLLEELRSADAAGRPPVLTIPGAAGQLSCSEMHIYRLIAAGELRAVDISMPGSGRSKTRIRADDLASYIWKTTITPMPAETGDQHE
jgi:excisionase family DNA binding protein